MGKIVTLIIFIFSLIGSLKVHSKEVRYLVRSPRALLMGDAFTALANDEYTLFYNPASLSQNQGLFVTPFNPDGGITNALDKDEQARFKNFPSNDAAEISNRLTGFPVFLHVGYTPGIKAVGFAMSFIINNTTSFILSNNVHPTIDIDYRYDRGVVGGVGFNILKKGNFRVGIGGSGKIIKREALDGTFDLFGTTLLRKIQESDAGVDDVKDALGFSKGKGVGFDVGVELEWFSDVSSLKTGISILDIADTRFKIEKGTQPIPRQDMFVNWGVSWTQDWAFFDYSLAFDLKPMNKGLSFGRMSHLGLQFGIPGVRAFGGISEGYISYGAMVDIFFIKLMAGFYSVELGTNYKEFEGKRALLYGDFLSFSYEVKF